MKIKRRMSDGERLRKLLPKGANKAVKQPLLRKLASSLGYTTPIPLSDLAGYLAATDHGSDVKSLQSYVIKLATDNALLLSGYAGFLHHNDREKLHGKILRHTDKLYSVNWRVWHLWMWDIYHAPLPDRALRRIKPKPSHKVSHR